MSTREVVGDDLLRRPAVQRGHHSLRRAGNSGAKSSRPFSSAEPRDPMKHRVKASGLEPPVCAFKRPPGLSCLPVSREQWLNRLSHDASSVLTEMYLGGASSCPAGAASALGGCGLEGQMEQLRERCGRMGTPAADAQPAEAFSSISGGCDYSGENSPAVPLDESLLSLRPAGTAPTELCQLLGPKGREEVQMWMRERVLPNSVGLRSLKASGMKTYYDPALRRSARRYARVLQML